MYGVDWNVISYISWLVSLMLAVQNTFFSGRGGHGGKFPKQNKSGTLPCKGGEVGACKDLEGNFLPSDLGIKRKMVICYVPPRIS